MIWVILRISFHTCTYDQVIMCLFIVVTFAQSEYIVSEVEGSIQLVLILSLSFPMEIVVKVGDVSVTADGEPLFVVVL